MKPAVDVCLCHVKRVQWRVCVSVCDYACLMGPSADQGD